MHCLYFSQGPLRDDYSLADLVDLPESGDIDEIDSTEIFGGLRWLVLPAECLTCVCGACQRDAEHIRHINDPEHPLTLEQLKVTTVRELIEGVWSSS